MTAASTLFATALMIGLLGSAQAATHKLDDSASQVLSSNVQMQWRSPLPSRSTDHDVETRVRVNIRIHTASWIGRVGKIYMVLPQDSGPRITSQWETQGKLLAGRMASGERALVYSGLITQPELQDQFLVYLRTDGRWSGNTRRLNFHFELDTD